MLILAKLVELAVVVLEGDVVEACLVAIVKTAPSASSLHSIFAVLSVGAILAKVALVLSLKGL